MENLIFHDSTSTVDDNQSKISKQVNLTKSYLTCLLIDQSSWCILSLTNEIISLNLRVKDSFLSFSGFENLKVYDKTT